MNDYYWTLKREVSSFLWSVHLAVSVAASTHYFIVKIRNSTVWIGSYMCVYQSCLPLCTIHALIQSPFLLLHTYPRGQQCCLSLQQTEWGPSGQHPHPFVSWQQVWFVSQLKSASGQFLRIWKTLSLKEYDIASGCLGLALLWGLDFLEPAMLVEPGTILCSNIFTPSPRHLSFLTSHVMPLGQQWILSSQQTPFLKGQQPTPSSSGSKQQVWDELHE